MRTRHRQPSVLGLCSFTHDSAAALIADGNFTGMAEEERLSGVKHTRDYPAKAVEWLLNDKGLSRTDVDVVAYNFAGHRYLAGIAGTPVHLMRAATRSRAFPRAASFAVVHHRFRQRMKRLKEIYPNGRVRCVPHHMAHGMYAYAASDFDDAAVLIIDSLGETCTTSISAAATRADGTVRYRLAEAISDPASLGYAYGAVTAHLGWRRGDEEGTVMALAALGDPARFRDVFARAIPLTDTGFILDPALFPLRVLQHGWSRVTPAFVEATCPPRGKDEEVAQVHADVAAALQERGAGHRPPGAPGARRDGRATAMRGRRRGSAAHAHLAHFNRPMLLVKSPFNSFRIPLIEQCWGITARYIHIVRDQHETADSIRRNRFEFSAGSQPLDGGSAWSLFVNAIRDNAPADRTFVVRHDKLLSDAQRVIEPLLMSL